MAEGDSVLVTIGVELEAALLPSWAPAGRKEKEEISHLAPKKLPLQVKSGFLCVFVLQLTRVPVSDLD